MYMFQLIQEVAELMGDQVGRHCTTLSCIEDILVRFILKWWADDPVTHLQIIINYCFIIQEEDQLSCPFLISFNGKYPSLMKPGISTCPHRLKWLLLFILPTLVKLNNKIFTMFANYQAIQKYMTSEFRKAILGAYNSKITISQIA